MHFQLPLPCSDHAPNHCSVLIFLCTFLISCLHVLKDMNCDGHCPISSCWLHCSFKALLLGALTQHGRQWTTVMAPCLPWLEAPSFTGYRPLEQMNSWIMHCCRTTIVKALLPTRRSREAEWKQASMLVSRPFFSILAVPHCPKRNTLKHFQSPYEYFTLYHLCYGNLCTNSEKLCSAKIWMYVYVVSGCIYVSICRCACTKCLLTHLYLSVDFSPSTRH